MRAGKRNNQGSDRDSVSSTSSTKSEDALSNSMISHDRSSVSLAASSTAADPMPLPVHKTQAAFVNKLYRMLEDHEMQDLISWSQSGDLFSVSNPTQFSKVVLPQYFKHNNWQSFVRQLNMYGFHKVNDMIHHSNITNESQAWEFRHPSFRRGGIQELQNIKRKSANRADRYPRNAGSNSSTTIATSSRLANAAENLPSELQDDQQDALQKHIYAMEGQIRKLAHSYEKLLADTTVLKKDLARQNHMLTDIAARVKLYNTDEEGSPTSQRSQTMNGSSESSNSRSTFYEQPPPPRRPNFQTSQSQYTQNTQHSPWNDSAYSSTTETGPSIRELRSVLPPPAGYTQRRQGSLPSPRLPINRPFTKDESVNARPDSYTYTRDPATPESSEHWSQSSNDKSAQLSPITRSPFRPSLPARVASSPFPMKQNSSMGLGRESNLLNVTNRDDAPGRTVEDHRQPEDAHKRRRL
ncbi:hypothetical protein INT44_007345 [Umbelopsis vinacea]|uniref:HSF-type DNA-binding domain-containing protein n=1 Tax=Umbelopsis vinacea TaxID=44442 RepID=A0A8H7PMK2_9FUNG|nr:hypothetical protein INT44_007345 [Umbelopsis vinacea]